MIVIPQPDNPSRSSVGKHPRDDARYAFEQSRLLLAVAVLFLGTAISVAQTSSTSIPNAPTPSAPAAQNPFAGSVASEAIPGVVRLSLQDAIDRGLKQNLGVLLSNADIRSSRGQRWEQLSALLPHVTAGPSINVSQINLAELGISFHAPGLNLPPSVGPFSYFDARLNVTQSLFDWKSINNARASSQSLKSTEYTYKDARDLVVLAVGFTYLQTIADEARVETADGEDHLRPGIRSGECGHLGSDRWAAGKGGDADAATAVDPSEKRLGNSETGRGPCNRTGSRAGIRVD
jgi:hypothetical protein